MAESKNSKRVLFLIFLVAFLFILSFYASLLLSRPRKTVPIADDPEIPQINLAFRKTLAENSSRLAYIRDRADLSVRDPQEVRHLSFFDCSPSFVTKSFELHPKTILVIIDNSGVDDNLLKALARLRFLREVRFRTKSLHCNLSSLQSLMQLEALSLSEVETVKSEMLIDLSKISSLRSLSFGRTCFSNADFRVLSKLNNLTEFIVYDSNFSDGHWATLDHQGLHVLVLNKCNVTDAGLTRLIAYPSLRILSLEQCNISDALLYQLPKCPMLRRCYLSGTSVSRRNAEVFGINRMMISIDFSFSMFDLCL